MENFKFILSSIIILTIVGFIGYWAFSTIESGSGHVSNQTQKELTQKNEELDKEVINLKRQISLLESEKEIQAQKDQETLDNKESVDINLPTSDTKDTSTLKYQNLVNDLQKLLDGNVYLKSKSQGLAVGTIQEFLNVYNNTSNKVDNDYGAGTATSVKNFQKDQGLTIDGETGPNTYKKMISWLKTK
jgi:murein L,D-transpeptidase YcbB/YkuD